MTAGAAAEARVPTEIGLGTNLVGPPATIRTRLREYERCGVTTLRVGVSGSFDEKIAALEMLVGLAGEVGQDQPVEQRRAPS